MVEAFLNGEARVDNPFLIRGMNEAVERIRRAIRQGERIAVYGDFDEVWVDLGYQGIKDRYPTFYSTPMQVVEFPSLDKEGWRAAPGWFDRGDSTTQIGALYKIHLPHKKPRKSKKDPNPTLTPKQKKENRVLSRTRVAVEHRIGDIKIFQSLTIQFRNHIKNLVAGLCNLKNDYVVQ